LKSLYVIRVAVGANHEVNILELNIHRSQGAHHLSEEMLMPGINKDLEIAIDEIAVAVILRHGSPGKCIQV
jgi:hypothetical protein